MCGIFGFITRDGRGPDIARLRRLALITQTRGAHAFGLAWLDEDGRIRTFKQPGPAKTHLDAMDRCRNAVVMVGHCRYATHGSPQDNRNNHPHAAGAGFLVHNGVVGNYRQVVQRYRFNVRSECDSEIFGLLMTRCGGSISQRLAWAASQAQGDFAVLGIWRGPARLLVGRRGRPLHFGQARDGYYFASLPQGLPGRVHAVADRTARILTYTNGGLLLQRAAVRLPTDGADNKGDEKLRWLGD